jgi:hypothetical protein
MKLSDEQLKEFAEQMPRDDFAAQLNSEFRVDQNFDAKLIEVTESKLHPQQESFSMLFLMPHEFPITQGIYNFEHSELGTHDIFVVPIEQSADGIVFEAVVNRLLPKD